MDGGFLLVPEQLIQVIRQIVDLAPSLLLRLAREWLESALNPHQQTVGGGRKSFQSLLYRSLSVVVLHSKRSFRRVTAGTALKVEKTRTWLSSGC